MLHRKYIKCWLLALFATETLCVTYGLKAFPGNPVLTILYLSAGIAIGILLMFFPPLPQQVFPLRTGMTGGQLAKRPPTGFIRELSYQKWVLVCLAALVMYTLTGYWLEDIPIDISYADMLPIIKVMDQRFAAGHWKQVYDIIPEIRGGVRPIYLPAMWLPYTPAVVMNIDMRWITTAGLFISFCVFLFVYRPSTGKEQPFGRNLSFFTAVIAFLLFWWLFSEDMPAFISMSEEGMVVCWYTLLVLALLTENGLLIGIAVSLCLLSRYALVGWAPAYFLYLLLFGRRKQALIFSSTGLACLLFLFIMPFGWPAFTGLLSLPGDYIGFAKTVWARSPEVFIKGLGVAKFFGPGKAGLLHTLLVMLSFGIPILFVFYAYYRSRKRVANHPLSNIPLATLKISVVVFYNFIDVPYLYLFYTSSFISLILVAVAMCTPDDQTISLGSAPAPARFR